METWRRRDGSRTSTWSAFPPRAMPPRRGRWPVGRDGVTRRAPARWAGLVIPALVVGAWVGLWAAPVRAAIVMIVRPAVPSPATSEALSRLRGELLSVGLTVEVVTRPSL